MLITASTVCKSYTAIMKQRTIYSVMTIGGIVGMTAAFIQTLEKLTLLEYKGTALTCDLNSVFSCTNVLSAWQSSVFGFPNSIMCMVLFTIFTATAFVGATGGRVTRGLRLGIQALSLGTLGFALWFLEQSVYSIGSLCIFCLFCFSGLLLVNWGWLRLNAADLPIGQRGRAVVARGITQGADIVGWFLLAAVVASAMLLQFG